MSKGKGRAGKQVRSKKKGKESANKRRMYDAEIEEKRSESDDGEGGGESVGEEMEVCLFSLFTLRC
jgi:hypothetical protein